MINYLEKIIAYVLEFIDEMWFFTPCVGCQFMKSTILNWNLDSIIKQKRFELKHVEPESEGTPFYIVRDVDKNLEFSSIIKSASHVWMDS